MSPICNRNRRYHRYYRKTSLSRRDRITRLIRGRLSSRRAENSRRRASSARVTCALIPHPATDDLRRSLPTEEGSPPPLLPLASLARPPAIRRSILFYISVYRKGRVTRGACTRLKTRSHRGDRASIRSLAQRLLSRRYLSGE